MNGSQRDIIPMAEFVNLIKYLKKRLTVLVGMFILGLGIGYPLSGDIISWFLQANGYLPDDVELIIIQPMEVILLRLRIATQIGFGLVLATLIIDLSWNGKKLINKSNNNENFISLSEFTYSIDPEGCEDVDDAFTLCSKDVLAIHIADITSLFGKGSELDNMALNQFSSVYLKKIKHLMPTVLSTDCASLLAFKIRPALTLEITFDMENRDILSSKIQFNKIQNGNKLSYEVANELLMNGEKTLDRVYEMCKILEISNNKILRLGKEDLLFGNLGNLCKDSHKMIENMMIYMNLAIADYLSQQNTNAVFRTVSDTVSYTHLTLPTILLV